MNCRLGDAESPRLPRIAVSRSASTALVSAGRALVVFVQSRTPSDARSRDATVLTRSPKRSTLPSSR